MRKARYRIDEVSIEGFRGFTKPQTIPVEGKNLFVFGPNGRGKSSIVEAIRWCLFGGAKSGKEIELRNTFYDEGDCVVTLRLVGEAGTLHLRREMKPSIDRSKLSIRNATGEDVHLSEVLPELARIGHEEGTQVIFAAQHGIGRQATVELSDFTEILCFYLHLEDAPVLVKKLRRIFEERTKEAERMAAELSNTEHAVRIEHDEIKTQLDFIVSNRPWGEGESPTGDETSARINVAFEEYARIYGQTCPKLSGQEALSEMKAWVERSNELSKPSRDTRLTGMDAKLQHVRSQFEGLNAASAQVRSRREAISKSELNLSKLQAGTTIENLRSEVERIKNAMSARDLRKEIARYAESLTEVSPNENCPLCDRSIKAEELKKIIAEHLQGPGIGLGDATKLSQFETKIFEIEQAQRDLHYQKQSLSVAEVAELATKKACYAALGLDLSGDLKTVQDAIDQLAADVDSIRRENTYFAAERLVRLKSIKDLESELKYHNYRAQLDRTKAHLDKGLAPARDALAAYRSRLNSLKLIADEVERAFNSALDRVSPILNKQMTDVYSRLTQQVSYDQVCIFRTLGPPIKRELKVASSALRGETFPPNVLNGQAAKALQLVPYFVFSRFQPEVMELDLLLIDDPSESFDTSHVQSLVQELALAAQHAQIIVATHEKEKFESHLRSEFVDTSYQVLDVKTFDRIKGPKIECG